MLAHQQHQCSYIDLRQHFGCSSLGGNFSLHYAADKYIIFFSSKKHGEDQTTSKFPLPQIIMDSKGEPRGVVENLNYGFKFTFKLTNVRDEAIKTQQKSSARIHRHTQALFHPSPGAYIQCLID